MASKSNKNRWMMGLLSASIGLALSAQAQALSPPLPAKDVVVHLFEWDWKEIANECENYLGPKGFKAVQISPPTDHINHNTWWARYQPVSYNNFTSRSGNEAELKDMITRCNAAGVEILADLVFNQMANYGDQDGGKNGEGTSVAGVRWSSKSYTYDGMGRSDFQDNACSIDNYRDANHVWTCALSGMPDVKTSNPATQDKLATYINTLKGFGVSMFRVDAAKHMAPGEVAAILGKAGNPWAFLEVIGAGGEAPEIQPDKYTGINNTVVTEFGYASALYNAIEQGGGLAGLSGIANGKLGSDKAFVFVTNHDRERGHGGASTIHYLQNSPDNNRANGELAHIFMLAYPYGTPAVHSGYIYRQAEPGGDNDPRPAGATNCDNSRWLCQHRWPKIGNMVGFRNAVAGTTVANWSTDGNNRIAFARGNKGFVAINNEGSTWSKSFQTGLPAGEYCDVLSGSNEDICSGQKVVVDSSGNATISISGKSAAAIYVGDTPPAGKPTVKITGAPTGWVAVGTSVTLTADARDTDDTDEIVSYKWSSGETTPTITKVLATEGKQTFSVTVTDNEGDTANATVNINVGDEPAVCNLPSLFVRGTISSWTAGAPLKCVGANRWEADFEFSGLGDDGGPQRFKFLQEDGSSAWSSPNWGDADGDGVLDTGSKNDITSTLVGSYTISVDDAAMTYTITEAGPKDAKPVAKITYTGSLTVDIAKGRQLVKLSGLTSSDAEGAVSYAWSRGAASSCLEGEGTFIASEVGSYPITLTVKDSAGQTATDTVTVTVIDGDAAPAPVVSIQASSTSVDIKNGPQTVTFTAKITGDDTGLTYEWSTGENGASITKTYSAKGNDSVWVDVSNADDVTTRATISVSVKNSGEVVDTSGYGLYRTNPNGGKGKSATITVDGNPSEWTQDMLIAQGVANDDARGFKGGHEGPVYDLYALYAAWDDANIYLMWQYTNVTDVVDPAQNFPISDNGKPWNANIPIQLAFDIDPSKEADGTVMDKGKKTSVWGDDVYNTFANGIDHLLMFSAKPKVGEPAVFKMNPAGSFDYGKEYVLAFEDAGIEYMYGDHQFVKSVMAINKSGWDETYTYASLGEAGSFVDMTTLGHSAAQDTIYEMKIPMSAFGIDRAYLESQGIGVMLVSTFGQSGIDSLPHDKATLDNVEKDYGPDASTSAEKNDADEFTAAPARIGN